ncbi:MAG: hypothetical protein ACP5GX_05325, partial [Anaerolineae bacterium]
CGWLGVDAVTYGPLFEETEPFWITQGPWIEGEALRNFILDRSSIWLGYFDDADERFLLDFVGYLRPEVAAPEIEPQVRFEGGPLLLRTIIERADADRWRVAFDWYAQGPVNATIFVHVRDGAGNVVTQAQADGPAMSGLFFICGGRAMRSTTCVTSASPRAHPVPIPSRWGFTTETDAILLSWTNGAHRTMPLPLVLSIHLSDF